MSRVIGILSGKGGVGKTTTTANLGTIFTLDFGINALLIDNSVAFSHLGLHLGLYDGFKLSLKDALAKKIPVSHAIQTHPTIRVKTLLAPLDGTIKFSKWNRVLRQLKKDNDIILVDCNPGFGKDVLSLMGSIEEALIITTPQIPDISDASKVICLLKKLKKNVIGIVVNRVKNEKYELSIEEIKNLFKVPIISVILEDPKIPEGIARGVPIVLYNPNSKSSFQFKKLASHILGREYVSPSLWERIKAFFGFRKGSKKFYFEDEKIYKEELKDLQKELEVLKSKGS